MITTEAALIRAETGIQKAHALVDALVVGTDVHPDDLAWLRRCLDTWAAAQDLTNALESQLRAHASFTRKNTMTHPRCW